MTDTTSSTDVTTTSVPTVTLNDGRTIPQLGFGVFQVPPEDTAEVTGRAIEIGYRHIDTAQMYGNEEGVGRAVKDSGLGRDEFFITSKLNNGFHRPDDARTAFADTLSKLGVEQVDLFLIHWPLPTLYGGDFSATWRVLEEFYREGRARSIGVSNFTPHQLRRLARETEVTPAVNQVEVHPYFTNSETREYGVEHQIATEAWSPIAQGKVLDDPTIGEIAERVGKSTAQVTLRWHIERGDVVFPKSVTTERMQANFEIFDFELADTDIAAISGLDKGEAGRTGPNPEVFDYIPD